MVEKSGRGAGGYGGLAEGGESKKREKIVLHSRMYLDWDSILQLNEPHAREKVFRNSTGDFGAIWGFN
jgi:hypothetical protein